MNCILAFAALALLPALSLFAQATNSQEHAMKPPAVDETNVAKTNQSPGSPWRRQVVSAKWVKPHTQDEPQVHSHESVLKVTVRFEYRGPDGEVRAPVLVVRDGTKAEYIMLGNLQMPSKSLGCMDWLMSSSHVRFDEKPEKLSSKIITGCRDGISFYFSLPENPKRPLVLLFADAAPIPLSPD